MLNVIFDILLGDTETIRAVFNHPRALQIALQLVALGVLSESIGQSIILFANRVKFSRFWLSLIVNVILYMLRGLIYIGLVWMIPRFITNDSHTLRDLILIVGLAHTPLLFSFFGFFPYLGYPILQFLRLYMYVLTARGVATLYDVRVWQAVLLLFIAWTIFELISATIGRPVRAFARNVLNWASGTNLIQDYNAILPDARTD